MTRWELTYDWAGRLGAHQIAHLQAVVTVREAGVLAAVERWLGVLDRQSVLDLPGEVYGHGGATVTVSRELPDRLAVSLRSGGEDAFDSIQSAADALYDAVCDGGGAAVQWVEMPYEPALNAGAPAKSQAQTGPTIWICETCAVETAAQETPPDICAICDDERQWVPEGGSRWTTLERQRQNGTRIVITEVEPELWGLRAEPAIGIGQQMMVVRTPEGTLLFDCVGYVDDEAVEFIRGLGPTLAVAASHPHMYGVQTEWAAALEVPVLVAERDREWVRRDERVEFYDERREVAPGLTLHRVGGHFRGQAVVEWVNGNDGLGILLAGDAIFPNPDRRTVSFMRSYPNRLPLSGNVVQRLAAQVERLHFDRLYNNLGAVVPADAQAVIRYSADRHTAWVRGDFDHLT